MTLLYKSPSDAAPFLNIICLSLCCRCGCVWSLWECPASTRPLRERTTRPSWSSASQSSTPESCVCSFSGCSFQRWSCERLDWPLFYLLTPNFWSYKTKKEQWTRFLQVNFSRWHSMQNTVRLHRPKNLWLKTSTPSVVECRTIKLNWIQVSQTRIFNTSLYKKVIAMSATPLKLLQTNNQRSNICSSTVLRCNLHKYVHVVQLNSVSLNFTGTYWSCDSSAFDSDW